MSTHKSFPINILVIVAAALFALAFSLAVPGSRVLAKAPQPGEGVSSPQRGGMRVIGQVTSVEADRFTIETGPDSPITILVSEQTLLRDTIWNEIALADLNNGDWVGVTARLDSQGMPVSRLVVLLPEDYEPSQRPGRRARGHVIGVDPQEGTFSIHTLREENLQFIVNENTVYRGLFASLEDLQPGMISIVAAIEQPGGELLAVSVRARFELVRTVGKVTQLDIQNGTFTMHTWFSGDRLITVDNDTRFQSRDGSVDGLEDLQPGMFLLVGAQDLVDGQYLARVVNVIPGL